MLGSCSKGRSRSCCLSGRMASRSCGRGDPLRASSAHFSARSALAAALLAFAARTPAAAPVRVNDFLRPPIAFPVAHPIAAPAAAAFNRLVRCASGTEHSSARTGCVRAVAAASKTSTRAERLRRAIQNSFPRKSGHFVNHAHILCYFNQERQATAILSCFLSRQSAVVSLC